MKYQSSTLFLDTLVKRELRPFGQRKIVIVDDCSNSLLMIRKYLEGIPKLSVELYKNEFYAMKSIISDEPDLIVLDIEMPRIDGIELSRFLKGMSLFDNPPLFISRDRKYKKLLGHNSNSMFLARPLNKLEYLGRIDQVVLAA